ncbi:pentapeptide repeat-containing protein [Streptomyces sp. NPDC002763]|uniref:pentapeptide repeat-containing protein n=1 Tax=Streptomyces sp. NPDC002763 TaxID=3154427 RepID=UPI00332CDE80
MITLHDVYKQGSGAVKTAVLAFGARHPLNDAAPDAEPDWDQAEQHFTRLIETIMGAAVPPGDSGRSHRAPGRERGHPLPSVGQQPAWLPLSHLCQAAGPRCEPPAYPGGDVTYDERAEHAARLRGLLYLACPDAPAWAIESTAEAITQHAEETPGEPVPEAAHLSLPQQQPSDVDRLNLTEANLTEANLTEANLTGVDLTPADLSDADLTRAKLTVASLGRANLTGANLAGADLTDTNLTDTNLTDTNLTGAMLTGATDMRLPQGAIWNRETLWPANLASDVAEYSDEVSPGIYQVRGGGRSPDRDTIRV